MAGSFQNEIPAARINLKLDVGKGTGRKKMELPLRMLVLGDFSCAQPSTRIAEREKIAVTRDNFTQVMQSMELSLHYRVDNTLSGEGELPIALSITSMDSFKPEQIARAVPQLSRLLAARNLIKDLKSNLLDNREFRKRLEEILKDPQAARSLQEQLKSLVPPHTDDTAV